MSDCEKREYIQTVILALLLARKGGCTLLQLDEDYYEQEGKHIPWRSFGHVSLLDFLQSMQKTVQIENERNTIILKGIPTNKSKHVDNLVSGQKSERRVKKNPFERRSFRPSHYYPNTAPPKKRVPAELLAKLINLIEGYPDGISKDYALQIIQSHMPHANLCMGDLEKQLLGLSHKVFVHDHKIFPARARSRPSINWKKYSDTDVIETQPKEQQEPTTLPRNYCPSGSEDSSDIHNFEEDDEIQEIPSGFVPFPAYDKKIVPFKKPISSFIQETVFKLRDQRTEDKVINTKLVQERQNVLYDPCQSSRNVCSDAKTNNYRDTNEHSDLDCENIEILINDRLKFRLEKLIQKHPEGIWCADLPGKYLEDYKIPLNYEELGFGSIREFTSYLPDIFHCVQPYDMADFMLYDAKADVSSVARKNGQTTTLAELHKLYTSDDEAEALPTAVSICTSKELIPDGVMTIKETVGVIDVEDLVRGEKSYVEVVVVEVFTPSFFWVQLRGKLKSFLKFMNELHTFYTSYSEQYVIPLMVLERGLNCACMYNGTWHRGIIKAVKPDMRVTVLFYDYGTLKTYSANAIHYLHKKFSNLPAQAIPCGLINVKPCTGRKWTQSVTHQFAVRTSEIPLIATVISVNAKDNSMMVSLADTLTDDDTHINDWLVENGLAVYGNMVCMKSRNFPFLRYMELRQKLIRSYGRYKSAETLKSTTESTPFLSEKDFNGNVAPHDSELDVNGTLPVPTKNFDKKTTAKVRELLAKNLKRLSQSRSPLTSEIKESRESAYEKLINYNHSSISDSSNNLKKFSSDSSMQNEYPATRIADEEPNTTRKEIAIFDAGMVSRVEGKHESVPRVDTSFPQTISNGKKMIKHDRVIPWAPSGNISKTKNLSRTVLRMTKESVLNGSKNTTIAISRNTLCKINGTRSIEKVWETGSSQSTVDKNEEVKVIIHDNVETEDSVSTDGIGNIIPSKDIVSREGVQVQEEPLNSNVETLDKCPIDSSTDTRHIENYTTDFKSCPTDSSSVFQNDYVSLSLSAPKFKILNKWMQILNIDDTLNPDSDDLSTSEATDELPVTDNKEDLCEELTCRDSMSDYLSVSNEQQKNTPECENSCAKTHPDLSEQEIVPDVTREIDDDETDTEGKNNDILTEEQLDLNKKDLFIPVFNDVDRISNDESEWDINFDRDDFLKSIICDKTTDTDEYVDDGAKIVEIDDSYVLTDEGGKDDQEEEEQEQDQDPSRSSTISQDTRQTPNTRLTCKGRSDPCREASKTDDSYETTEMRRDKPKVNSEIRKYEKEDTVPTVTSSQPSMTRGKTRTLMAMLGKVKSMHDVSTDNTDGVKKGAT